MSPRRRIVLSAEFIGAALAYVFLGGYGSFLSQAILFCQAGILFICVVRYMKKVEGRELVALVPFSLLVWSVGWTVEYLALKTGFLGGRYFYDASHLLSFGPAGVPLIVPTAWLIFGYLSGSITHFLFQRLQARRMRTVNPRREFLAQSLLSGWLMLSLGVSVEWHFSHVAGFWNWRTESDAGSFLNGVPLGNFLLWLGFGLLLPLFERLAHSPKIQYRDAGLFLQALPATGFGVLLLAGLCLNAAYGFVSGAIVSCVSIIVLGSFLYPLFRALERSSKAAPTRRWNIRHVRQDLSSYNKICWPKNADRS